MSRVVARGAPRVSVRSGFAAASLALGLLWAGAAGAQTRCRTVTTPFPSVEQTCEESHSSSESHVSHGGQGGGVSFSFGADDRPGDEAHGRDARDGDGAGLRPRLIERARIGRIREIFGAARLVARPEDGCPAPAVVEGLCFARAAAGLAALGRDQGVVVGLRRPPAPGQSVGGRYGESFGLYEVTLKAGVLAATPLPAAVSEVSVPRACFALPDEGVVYLTERRGDQEVAQERQTVVCGGGAPAPRGPYVPDESASAEPAVGSAPPTDRDAWPPTGAWLATGPARYLGVPDPACDPAWLMHKTVCARAGVLALQADPGLKELDLIVAKTPPRAGDLLVRTQVEQWVLKRRDQGFKIDKRWFEKSFLPSRAGCERTDPVRFRVFDRDGALFVEEIAVNACGAPPAPIPADIVQAFGEELPVAAHRDGCPPSATLIDDLCFADAIGFMQGFGRTSTGVVLLRGEAYPGAELYPDHGLDMAVVTRNDDGSYAAAGGLALPAEGYGLDRCRPVDGGDPRRQGVKILARGNRPVAVAYRWMSCPIY